MTEEEAFQIAITASPLDRLSRVPPNATRTAGEHADRREGVSKAIDPEMWYTPVEVAGLLGIGLSTVRAWLASGKLASRRRGSRWWVRGGDLIELKRVTPRVFGTTAALAAPLPSGLPKRTRAKSARRAGSGD
jgi:excisionase family DNA binding protein